MRIAFVQYANPAHWPPTVHAMQCALAAGHDVRVLAVSDPRTGLPLPPELAARTTWLTPPASRLRRALATVWFAQQAARFISHHDAQIIVLSEGLGAVLALWPGARVDIYCEHDLPAPRERHPLGFLWRLGRRRLLVNAPLLITPNLARQHRALQGLRRTHASLVVANCPLRSDIQAQPRAAFAGPLVLHYHGTLAPERLPLGVLDAVARTRSEVRFQAAGYEVQSSIGYRAALLDRAQQLRISDRVRIDGPMPRSALLEYSAHAHVGLAHFERSDANHATMLGASNKIYDYWARGLAVLSDTDSDWDRDPAVAALVIREAQLGQPDALATRLDALTADLNTVHALGEAGRQRCLAVDHYEAHYAPVLAWLEQQTGRASAAA